MFVCIKPDYYMKPVLVVASLTANKSFTVDPINKIMFGLPGWEKQYLFEHVYLLLTAY